MSAEQFKYLFSPIEIGPYTVKNRLMCAHHGPMMAEQGIPTDEYVHYEIEKAKGGAGWVAMSVGYNSPRDALFMKPNGGHYDRQVWTWKKEIVPQMKRIADGVHKYGARVSFQWYASSLGSRIGPSVVPDCNFGAQMWSAITKDDIKEYLEYMAIVAENLMEAGFDGVDVHNHSGWVADFLSATINKRTDEYGGSLENRARLLMETIDTLRKVVGPDKTIGYTLTVDDLLPGSIVPEDGVELMRMLDRGKKVDFVIAGIARETQTMHMYFGPMYLPPAYQLYAVEQVKEVATNIPVIAVGRINDPVIAEQILAEGKCDMVAMARPLIADPELPNKALEGRLDDIRPCMGCNLNCIKLMFQGVPIRCVANPTIGMEWQGWGGGSSSIKQAPEKKKVIVVGGGPSGMEAARVAAIKGHYVTLYEKADELGGQALLAEKLPGREEMGGLIRWQKLQLPQAGVKVVTGTEATAQMILEQRPDVVVTATGSTWMRNGYFGGSHMEVAGWQQDNVYSADEIVKGITEGTLDIGKKAVIWDTRADIIPRAIAELMADQGCQVELVCPLPVAMDLQLDVTYFHVMPRILSKGVKVNMETFLVMIEGRTVTILNIHTMETREITDVDTIVLMTGKIPNDQLYDGLEGKVQELYKIGEARNPHDMGDANRDGHFIGRLI